MHDALPIYTIIHKLLYWGGGSALPCNYWEAKAPPARPLFPTPQQFLNIVQHHFSL